MCFEAALEAVKGWGCGDVMWKVIIRRWAEDGEGPGPIGFCGVFGGYEGGLGRGVQLPSWFIGDKEGGDVIR